MQLQFTSAGIPPKFNMSSTKKARIIDLSTDCVTQPTPAMRKAMFEAEVGDDDTGEDPTVNALEEKAASLLGKEAAMFVMSGTMGNLTSVMTHCDRRGAEMLAGDLSHIFLYEQGGSAQLAGIHTQPLTTQPDGTFDLQEMERKIRGEKLNSPITSLVCIEDTQTLCGGKALPLEWLDELGKKTKTLNLPLHMDGARIFNAAVYQKVPASRIVEHCSSCTFCLNKGLSAPLGSILVGSADFIRKARRMRKVLGGGTSQLGIVAAAGIVALDTMVERLEEDHYHTQIIAQALEDMESKVFHVDVKETQTNLLMISMDTERVTPEQFCERMARVTASEAAEMGEEVSVRMTARTESIARMALHADITMEDVQTTIAKLQYVVKEYDSI